MTPPMRDELLGIKVALAALLVGFTAYLGWEFTFNTPSSLAVVMAEIWGRAVYIDFYILIVVIGAWIVWRDRGTAAGWAWAVALLGTGSIGVLAYLLHRLRPLRRRADLPVLLVGDHR